MNGRPLSAIRFIYFDCMDTLVQMRISSLDEYARWAYQGAADLGLWESEEGFVLEWNLHRDRLKSTPGDLREGTILGRIADLLAGGLARRGLGWPPERVREEAERIHERFWSTYRTAAFVLPEVPQALSRIQEERKIPMGVVSNFMVKGGIPVLLADHGLERFFQAVVVSCENGFRKPSESIFREALGAAGVAPGEVLFIGDSPGADYHGPLGMGMRPLLYDRLGLHPEIDRRIGSFGEIEAWIDR